MSAILVFFHHSVFQIFKIWNNCYYVGLFSFVDIFEVKSEKSEKQKKSLISNMEFSNLKTIYLETSFLKEL